MAVSPQFDADREDGSNIDCASGQQPTFAAQLRSTLNTIPAYTWYAAPSGALTFVNERNADYLGLPKDDPLRFGIAVGAAWDSHIRLLHPDDHEETRRAWSTCLRTGSGGEVTFRVRNAEGEYRWFLSRAEPLRASDGTLLYWIGVNLDIEERKLAKQGLQQSEERFRSVLESIAAQVITTTLEGEIEFVNQPVLDYFGKTIEELNGWRTSGDVVHPDDLADAIAVWRRSIEKGVSYDVDHRFRRSDGVYRWFHVRGRPQRDAQGSLIRWYALLTDIDERKKAEQRLEEREMELRQILDLTPQLIAVFGPRRERLYVNRMALDYFGLTLDEWRNTAPGAVSHPDDTKRVQAQWDRGMSSGCAFELEGRLRKNDGSYRWFLVRYNPVHDNEGRVLRWYAACTDIDGRKRDEERLQQENAALREEINQAPMFEDIVGSSEPLLKVLAQVSKVALSDSTVLVLGETGTGKELIARAIHKRSKRVGQPFIAVNCAAIPASLIASELFGHEKGSFTGATQRRLGRFEAANGGTIFLDEVGDLPPDIQIALLRVLQEREIERVGIDKPIPVDVRVLAATHRDLEKLVSEGKFRLDLVYRLNVVPITMPSLRERAADVPVLVEYFIARFGQQVGKKFRSIDKKTLDLLRAYAWPGNIRELQNVIERAVILSDSNIFAVDEAWLKREPSEVPHSSAALNGALVTHEREAIEAALAQSHGQVSGPAGAAAKLGVPDSTLDAKIKRLGINKYRFKSQMG
jgi:formate hydrogenlyase transcriptional activator